MLDRVLVSIMFVVPVGPSTSISFFCRLTDAPEGSLFEEKIYKSEQSNRAANNTVRKTIVNIRI
jgi:hypothetical protein